MFIESITSRIEAAFFMQKTNKEVRELMENEAKKAPARKTRKKAAPAAAEQPVEEVSAEKPEQPAEEAAAAEEAAPPCLEPEWATVQVGDFQGLNVRAGKSIDSEVVGTLPNHAEVEAYPEEDGWRELAGGGYVVARYLD